MNVSLLATSTAFICGLMVGSFLNVCIWRLPAEEQIVKGRSHCRSCQHLIPWYDNVPMMSFLLLRGKCRFCGARISWSYPAVELATGILFAGLLYRFGATAVTAFYAVFAAALIVATVIDAREMIIPDEITKPGLGVGLIFSFLVPALHGTASRWEGLWAGALGAFVGWGIVFLMAAAGKRLFRKKLRSIGEEDAMGGGDLKLMAMVGAFIGWPKVLLVNLFLAPLVGSVVGLALRLREGRDLMPYGPFLALGTLVAIFWGDPMIQWYRNLFVGLQ